MKPHDIICSKHKIYEKETALSPARYHCKVCKQKKVSGYSNPDHICNPFGYLYLAPTICVPCSAEQQRCMWC
uniref:Uncharacterized protein n=1 Tax=viral metagenome TaxID=1070528 RepID=A0A6C0IMI4_9ZZZZ